MPFFIQNKLHIDIQKKYASIHEIHLNAVIMVIKPRIKFCLNVSNNGMHHDI